MSTLPPIASLNNIDSGLRVGAPIAVPPYADMPSAPPQSPQPLLIELKFVPQHVMVASKSNGDSNTTCSICLDDFDIASCKNRLMECAKSSRVGEAMEVVQLTSCTHRFHYCCIEKWLPFSEKLNCHTQEVYKEIKVSCPTCRVPITPWDHKKASLTTLQNSLVLELSLHTMDAITKQGRIDGPPSGTTFVLEYSNPNPSPDEILRFPVLESICGSPRSLCEVSSPFVPEGSRTGSRTLSFSRRASSILTPLFNRIFRPAPLTHGVFISDGTCTSSIDNRDRIMSASASSTNYPTPVPPSSERRSSSFNTIRRSISSLKGATFADLMPDIIKNDEFSIKSV
jgi:hypothetical protein